jgi:hypothetical protein
MALVFGIFPRGKGRQFGGKTIEQVLPEWEIDGETGNNRPVYALKPSGPAFRGDSSFYLPATSTIEIFTEILGTTAR